MNPELEKVLLKVQKPGRYAGGESNRVVKDQEQVDVRFAFCFPDVYEVGMSHLGMKILYGLFNEMDGVWCERVFAPWPDMEEQMREHHLPLYGLESGDAITDFDFIGFTLQYELSYSNVLNMLDLAGIPLYAKDRKGLGRIVVAGGPVPATVSLWPIFGPGVSGRGRRGGPGGHRAISGLQKDGKDQGGISGCRGGNRGSICALPIPGGLS